MTRSHAVLAAALLCVLALAGIVALADGRDGGDAAPPVTATTEPPGDAAAATTPPADDVATRASSPAAAPTTDPVVETAPATTTSLVAADCTVDVVLREGSDAASQVACLETALAAAGYLTPAVPDTVFDGAAAAAVRAFQADRGLVVDGLVGPQTAAELGIWSGPAVLPPDPATCPAAAKAAVVDRANQRAWLCADGEITREMPITSAWTQPDPGDYEIYAEDLHASSTLTGRYSEMTHFVAFTYGKYQGARIAFHSVPTYSDGSYVQPLDSVGTPERHGDSSGCIRVLPDDAVAIWDTLSVGDVVRVVS